MKRRVVVLFSLVALFLFPAVVLGLGEPIQAAKAATDQQSLFQFLGRLPFTMEAQIWYALLIGGALGMFAHYANGRVKGEIAGSPLDYFLRDNFWRSIGAAGTMAGELFAEIGTGLFTTEAGLFVGWGIVILSGIKSGYLGDSVINKGTRPIWTDAARTAAAPAAPVTVQAEAKKP